MQSQKIQQSNDDICDFEALQGLMKIILNMMEEYQETGIEVNHNDK